MISAVAFTPVLAVGVNVDNVKAAPSNLTAGEITAINEFYVAFSELDQNKKELVRIILGAVGAQPSYTLETAYSTQLSSQYSTLFTFSSTSNMTETEFQNKYSSFKSNVSSVKPDVTSADLVSFFNNVFNELESTVDGLQSSQYSNLAGSGIYQRLLDVYKDSNMPASVQPILKVPTDQQASELITTIQNQFNSYLNPGGPGPGPGPTDPPVDNGDGEVSTGGDTVENNPQQVIDVINAAEEVEELVVTLKGTDTEVAIPGTIFNALENKNSDAVIVVETSTGAYELPVSAVDLEALAEELDVTTAELKVVIKVDEVQTPALVNAQYDVILPSIDFEVTIIAPNGESIVLNLFPQPVKRSITATQQLAALTTVGVTVINGQVRGVPTFVTPGNTTANLYRAGNSTYTLVENFKTFKDVDKGANWSEEYVEKLASRLIVSGTTADTFSPNRSITRGEFASILSRGLGLVAKNPNVPFTDVSSTQAFNRNAEIAAVVEAGIVNGYKDGKFRPYQEINRGEAAIMISKALEYYGSDLVTLNKSKKVSNFEDYRYIGATTRPHIEKVLQAGYINGYSDGTYKSTKDASRAEMSRILYDFLNSIEFIN